jgi:hypothetical protein
MKRILFVIPLLISVLSFAQDYNGKRVRATDEMKPPIDTSKTKSGFAIIADTLYVGNGVYWKKTLLYIPIDQQPGDILKIDPTNTFITNARSSPASCNNTSNIGLSHVDNLTWAYTSGFYSIACNQYTLATGGTITLDDFDGTPGQFRTDAIILRANQGIVILKGDNSDDQVGGTKTVDPATEILLSYVTINSDNQVINVASTTVYYDNVGGWTHSTFGGATVSYADGTNPLAPSDSAIKYTLLPNNSGSRFTAPTTQSSTGKRLTFFIRHNATVNNARNWVIRKMNGANQVNGSSAVTLTTAKGYNKTAAYNNQWQLISIPLDDATNGFGGQDVYTGFEFRNTAVGGTVLQFIDSIRVESGIVINNGGGGSNITSVLRPLHLANGVLYHHYNILAYGADPTGVANSRDNIQAAINDCVRNDSACHIYVPHGKFRVDGLIATLNGEALNSILYIPRNTYTNHNVSITFEGETPPNFETQILTGVPPSTNGSLIFTTTAGSGTDPALMRLVQDSVTNLFTQLNYTNIQMYDLGFRTKAGTSMRALDLSQMNQGPLIDRVKVDIDAALVDQPDPAGNGTYGVKFPQINNHLLYNVGVLEVVGYDTAVILGEHVNINFLVVAGSKTGVSLNNNHHSVNINTYQVEGTKWHIVVGDRARLHINHYNTEHNSLGEWFDHDKDIKYIGAGSEYSEVDMDYSHVVLSGASAAPDQFHADPMTARFHYRIKGGAGKNFLGDDAGIVNLGNGGTGVAAMDATAIPFVTSDGNKLVGKSEIFRGDSLNKAIGIGLSSSPLATIHASNASNTFFWSVQDGATPAIINIANGGKGTAIVSGTNGSVFSTEGPLYFGFDSHSQYLNRTVGASTTLTMLSSTTGLGINVGGISSKAASAILDLQSVSQGILPPRMSGAQMNAIASPATGLFLYNTDSTANCFYNGAAWVKVGTGSAGAAGWALTGTSTLTGNTVIDDGGHTLKYETGSFMAYNSNHSTAIATETTPGTLDNPRAIPDMGAVKVFVDNNTNSLTVGSAAPATTPTKVGDFYLDSVAKKLYVATGTSSSADWTILN